jgi:hypothetical protein
VVAGLEAEAPVVAELVVALGPEQEPADQVQAAREPAEQALAHRARAVLVAQDQQQARLAPEALGPAREASAEPERAHLGLRVVVAAIRDKT